MNWILDNGHGGLVNGVYVTPGKRSPVWPDLPQLFEGVFNRQVVYLLGLELKTMGVKYTILVPEQEDISITERIIRVNRLAKAEPCILLSFHGNAGGGTGWEIWTSKGETASDKLVPFFFTEFSLAFPGEKMRTDFFDGDADKESDAFSILPKTKCPALLLENFFMDNPKDCRLMLSASGKQQMVKAYANTIKRVEDLYGKAGRIR